MDPFAGSPQGPQSLQKYLYYHVNPVKNVDPIGKFYSATDVSVTMGILASGRTPQYGSLWGDAGNKHIIVGNGYFGTSNPPPFIKNQTTTIFDPDTMLFLTTYYCV